MSSHRCLLLSLEDNPNVSFALLYYFGVNQSFRPQNLFFGMHRLLLLYNRSLVSMLVNLSCLSTKQFVCMDIYLLQ